MTSKFAGVTVSQLIRENDIHTLASGADVHFVLTGSECNIICFQNKLTTLTVNISSRTAEFTRLNDRGLIISHSSNSIAYVGYYFTFDSHDDRDKVYQLLKQMVNASSKQEISQLTSDNVFNNSVDDEKHSDDKMEQDERMMSLFDKRTDDASASQYFQFYGYLSQQQNMMQDFIRTSTYQRAILDNYMDFSGKTVLDVGAGSGILSFFAVQAGARKVYAIEASAIAAHAEALVEANGFCDQIKVLTGKLEDLELPEKVDVIISEPMGYMLFNERMLETYLHAKKWMKPDGKMFPSTGILFITPFTDEGLYMEQMSKCNFWAQTSFYAVDLSCLRDEAIREYFRQPVVDNFDVRVCLCKPLKHTINFLTANETDLHEMKIPLEFKPMTTAVVHGLAFWFDVLFDGSSTPVWLSTAPTQPLTHWYQVRCLMPNPLIVSHGQTLEGFVHFRSNTRQSYEIDIELRIAQTNIVSRNSLDLKNPFFRYTGQIVPPPPPGTQRECPTESFFTNACANQQYNVPGEGMDPTYGMSNAMPSMHSNMPSNIGGTNSSLINCCGNTINTDGNMLPLSQQYYPSNTVNPAFYEHSEQDVPGAIYFGDGTPASVKSANQSSYFPTNCNINNDTSGLYYAPLDEYSHSNSSYPYEQGRLDTNNTPAVSLNLASVPSNAGHSLSSSVQSTNIDSVSFHVSSQQTTQQERQDGQQQNRNNQIEDHCGKD